MTSLSLLLLIVGVPLAFVAGSLYLERQDAMSEPRYRLFRLDENGTPWCFAEAEDAAGVGLAIVTTAEEDEDHRVVGVLDAHARRWLVLPWTSRKQLPF